MRVLIVDDEEPLRAAIAMLLDDEGYMALQAENGADALDILRDAAEPMIVVLDWMMPLLDGVAVLRAAGDDPAGLGRHAYILVSALPRARHGELADLLGRLAAPMLPKPFEIPMLLREVERAAERLGGARPTPPDAPAG